MHQVVVMALLLFSWYLESICAELFDGKYNPYSRPTEIETVNLKKLDFEKKSYQMH